MNDDNKPKLNLTDKNLKLDPELDNFQIVPMGHVGTPNRNGVTYSPRALKAALENALDGGEVEASEAWLPNGQVPDFGQFLRMVAPNLTEERIREMVEMSKKMEDYGVLVARRREGQELYDRVQSHMRDKGLLDGRVSITLGISNPGDWARELDTFGRREADVEINIAPRMIDEQVTSYGVIKSRKGHPDALKVEIDSLPAWLRDNHDPLDPIDRDVQSQYLTPIGNPIVRTMNIPEPSFGNNRGCRSLLNTFAVARNRGISGDITINGKQRKELVSNAQGTMVYPRTKPKFGRR